MREFLKALGLETETIDSIMAEHGKLLTATTEKVTELTGKVNDLTAENNEFKKVDVESLKSEVETLKAEKTALEEEKTNLTTDHQKELDGIAFNSALEVAIINSKTVDPVGFKAHLDLTKLNYNKETKEIEGYSEQETALKQSQAHLFNVQPTGGFQGNLGGNEKDVDLKTALTESLKEN